MRVSRKKRRHFLENFKKLHPNYTTMDKLVHSIPYKNVSVSYAHTHGMHLTQPVAHYLADRQNYNPKDSRTLSFITLKHDSHNIVTICGFVSDYKLVFNHFYHQVAIYILLKYVAGITYDHHFKYLTDHLWIDPNLFNRIASNPTVISRGDFVIALGKPNHYNGHIGDLYGIKNSLDDAHIVACGYPYIKHNHLQYQAIPYNHHKKFIYRACSTQYPNVIIGNEMKRVDRSNISKNKYYVGYSNKFNVGVIIHQGLKPSLKKKNPRLIVNFSDTHKKKINSLRWTTNQYSIQHSIVLGSAKSYQHHPKRTEREIDNRLASALNKSSLYLIKQIINR